MFGTLGGPELFLILVIALIVFGPRKLPEIGKNLGRMMGEFRKASTDFQRTIEEEVEAVNRATEPPRVEPPAALPPATEPRAEAPGDPTVSRQPIEPHRRRRFAQARVS
jgi:sec-independent protein translocase protein TatB